MAKPTQTGFSWFSVCYSMNKRPGYEIELEDTTTPNNNNHLLIIIIITTSYHYSLLLLLVLSLS
jgi:hypothetical protein